MSFHVPRMRFPLSLMVNVISAFTFLSSMMIPLCWFPSSDNSTSRDLIETLFLFGIPNKKSVSIKSLDVELSDDGNQHSGIIIDERKVKADMTFTIKDNGKRILGTWKDNYYNVGNFSLEKVSAFKHIELSFPRPNSRERDLFLDCLV